MFSATVWLGPPWSLATRISNSDSCCVVPWIIPVNFQVAHSATQLPGKGGQCFSRPGPSLTIRRTGTAESAEFGPDHHFVARPPFGTDVHPREPSVWKGHQPLIMDDGFGRGSGKGKNTSCACGTAGAAPPAGVCCTRGVARFFSVEAESFLRPACFRRCVGAVQLCGVAHPSSQLAKAVCIFLSVPLQVLCKWHFPLSQRMQLSAKLGLTSCVPWPVCDRLRRPRTGCFLLQGRR